MAYPADGLSNNAVLLFGFRVHIAMTTDPSRCTTCGKTMTLVFKNKQTKYVCEFCDSDPFHSLKTNALLNAKTLQSPKIN